MMELARPLPQSVPLEEQLLGTILASPDAFRSVLPILRSEHFSRPLNAMLCATVLAQSQVGRGFDSSALMAALRLVWTDKVRDDMTVGEYVASLIARAGPPSFAVRMAQDLRDLWALREILVAAEKPTVEDGIPPRDQLSQLFECIDTVRAGIVDKAGGRTTAAAGANRTIENIRRAHDGQDIEEGATTGFADVDRMMLGYRPGELVVVAARPGMGKTTWATSSLRLSAGQGHGVILFSMELPEPTIAARLLSDAAHDLRHPLTHSIIRDHKLPPADVYRLDQAANELAALEFHVDYSTRLSVAEIAIKASALKKELAARGRTLSVLAIDYLKFLKATDRYKGQRVYEVGEITSGLKEIAKDLGLCVVLLCQLNRGVEGQDDKRPDLQHLRDSGDIESDADVVMFLYREAYYVEKSLAYRSGDLDAQAQYAAARNQLECIIAKNRNGPCGTVRLFCDIGASAVRNAERGSGMRAA